MLEPCDICHNDPEVCGCGPCELCPPQRRNFHKDQKDNLCEDCLVCNICKHPTMYWESYDEAWECSKCNELWEEYDRKEMKENPAHNARKDIPKHKKYSIWRSFLGKATEAKCFSCKITRIRVPKFCVIEKGGVSFPICVECSKKI